MADERALTRAAYVAKAEAELSGLAARGVVFAGNALSPIVLAKGDPSEAELAGEGLLSGRDGDALRAALSRLGYAPEDWCALATCDASGSALPAALLAEAVAALSPLTIVACDDAAAAALGATFGAELPAGTVTWVRGMRMLALGGFAAALEAGEDARQRAWRWLKQVPPLGEPY